MSLRCPFGRQARKVDTAPLFQAPLFRLDGILGRVLAQILCKKLIDAEPLMRGSEEENHRKAAELSHGLGDATPRANAQNYGSFC